MHPHNLVIFDAGVQATPTTQAREATEKANVTVGEWTIARVGSHGLIAGRVSAISSLGSRHDIRVVLVLEQGPSINQCAYLCAPAVTSTSAAPRPLVGHHGGVCLPRTAPVLCAESASNSSPSSTTPTSSRPPSSKTPPTERRSL